MHSFTYDLGGGNKCITHYNGDCTGMAIRTLIADGEIIVEIEEDIEDMTRDFLYLANEGEIASTFIIGKYQFPVAAIRDTLKSLSRQRIAYLMEEKIYTLDLQHLVTVEGWLLDG